MYKIENLQSSNLKCAEVFYQNFEVFYVVCTQCELKTFVFDDFLAHFKKVHNSQEEIGVFNTENIIIKSENTFGDDPLQREQSEVPDTLWEEPIETVCEAAFVEDFETREEDWNDCKQLDNDSSDDDLPLTMLQKKKVGKRKKSALTSLDCEECKKTYKTRKALRRHITRIHVDVDCIEPLKCAFCEKFYHTKEALAAHNRMKHRKKEDGSAPGTYPCTQCDKVYTDKYSLKYHALRHTGEKNFHCDSPGCNAKFYRLKLLNTHKRLVHVGLRNFVCEVCGHRTKTVAMLEMHKRIHTGEKPFSCKTCGKAFATQSAVTEHKVIHSADRPHVCDVCGKSFSRPKALYHHKPLHSDIKKFVCKICGKAYSQLAGLSAHKRQHTNEIFDRVF